MKKLLSFFFLLILTSAFADPQSKIDSIRTELKLAGHDTTRINLYLALGDEYFLSDPQKALEEITHALELSEKVLKEGNSQVKVSALRKKGEALNNLGYVYRQLGDLRKAVEFYYMARKVYEQTSDKRGLAVTLNNIGVIHRFQNQPDIALKNYEESLKLCEEIKDSVCIAQSLHSIGFAFKQQQNYDKALEYYHKSLEIREKLNDKDGIGLSLNNIGFLYFTIKDYKKAKPYFLKSLALRKDIGNVNDISMSLNNLGNLALKENKIDSALYFFSQVQKINQRKFLEPYSTACRGLYLCYKQMGKPADALKYYELYVRLSDSLSNEQLQKETMKQQLGYEYQKKQLADSLRNVQQQEQKDLLLKQQQSELSKERTQKYALGGGMVLLLLLAGVTYNAYSNKKKANDTIHEQKLILEEKNKDITDSINYAKRIQDTLLVQNDKLSTLPNDHFIFFKPRDIVSGDFYWSFRSGNYLYISVADCTGHGVPGAFMSLLGITFLDEIMRSGPDLLPSLILDKMKAKVVSSLQQTGESGTSKDGMDISMFRIDFSNSSAVFAAANNPGWIIRDNGELIEIKADKQPIGHSEFTVPFTDTTVSLGKGDMLYLFSDGYPDQFGGPKGKKFKYKPLQHLLAQHSHEPCAEQKKILTDEFERWRGPLEQVDDVCLLGLRF